MTAEASTKARLGSHDGAATSRNARTLLGAIMAETIRPKPKMSPEASAMSSFLIAQSPMTCRATYTVAAAVMRKTPVAASERGESLAIPQTPCPLVQPLPSRVPNPTRRPAAITTATGAGDVRSGSRPPAAR
jgi:hypothetical protein